MAKKNSRNIVKGVGPDAYNQSGPKVANEHKKNIDLTGKQLDQVHDMATAYENISDLQQKMYMEADALHGIEKKTLNLLKVQDNKLKSISLQTQNLLDMKREDRNILEKTISDYDDYNSAAAQVAERASELNNFMKQRIPFEDKIKSIRSEIDSLQQRESKGLSAMQKQRMDELGTLETQFKTLSKKTEVLDKQEKIQNNIKEAIDGQLGAAGQIFNTLKDIVTNPLTLFTGLLAIGLQRFETMRQRGNELAEEMDRVNKKLAGAGPYQDKILQKADLIKKRFYEMGEGFSSSLEGSVDAIVALGDEMGKVDYVTGDLVKTMAELKLSIGLSDESSAKVLSNFMMVNGQSSEAAVNMTDLTYQMAEQAGLNPQQVFQDIAAASGDTLATFSGSADELAKSAVQARRLGLTLDDMAKVSEGLLDFETSIEKEMEAQLITGMDLNFQKARMLAMQGDEAGAMEEVMRQVGGLDKFNKMMPYQQRALASAVGLTVGQLQKTTDQREKEAKHAEMKHDLVDKQYKLAEKALPMLGKLDAGLGVMERIAVVIGDLFLDVFGTGLKELEATFFTFLESKAFKTGFKNVLFTIKGVIIGIKDAVMGVASFIDKLSGGAIGGFLKSFASKDFSGSYGKAEGVGKTIGKGIAVLLGTKLLLGSSPLTPMFVSMGGGMSSMFGGLKKMLSGGLKSDGTPDLRLKGNKFGGGVMQNVGSKMFGKASVKGMGGLSSSAGGALMGGLAGAAIIGKGIYDVATLKGDASGREKGAAKSGLGGAALGAAIGTMILPGIGTGVGAAIGYIGGHLVAETGIFDDELDKSRKNLQRQQEQMNRMQRVESNKMMYAEKKVHSSIIASFKELSGGTDDLSKEGLKTFKDKVIKAGYVTENEWNKHVRNGASDIDLMNIATRGATTKLDNFAKAKQNEIDRLNEESGYSGRQMGIENRQSEISSLDLVSRADIEAFVEGVNGKRDAVDGVNAYFTGDAVNLFRDEFHTLAKQLIDESTGLEFTDAQIAKALQGAGTEINAFVTDDGLTADVIEDVIHYLKKDIQTNLNTELAEQTKIVNKNIIATNKKMKVDEAITTIDGGKVMKVTNVDKVEKKLADGGLLNGPSHASGGIQTKFGEMEGGEAVINKRSTAMFKNTLSQMNEAGGGIAFGDGGVTNGYYMHGGETPSQSLIDKYPVGSSGTGAWGQSQAAKEQYGWGPDHWADYQFDINKERSGIYTTKAAASKYGKASGKAPETYNVNTATWQYGLGDGYNQITSKGGQQAEMTYDGKFDPNKFHKARLTRQQTDRQAEAAMKDKSIADWQAMQPGTMPDYKTLSSIGHLALDVAGFVPVLGAIPDLLNVLWYTMEAKHAKQQGDDDAAKKAYKMAGLSGLAAIPVAGSFATVGKWAKGADKMRGPIGAGLRQVGKGADAGAGFANSSWFKGMDQQLQDVATLGFGGKAHSKPLHSAMTMYATAKTGNQLGLNPVHNYTEEKEGFEWSSPSTWFDKGGITPKANSPIKKVNDMIMTKDGQMIETHPDDNLIAKKGNITQNTSTGGKSKVEELLEKLIMVTSQKGDVFMDGAKVSAAVNESNYRA